MPATLKTRKKMADITILGFLQSSRIVNDGRNICAIVDEYQPPFTHTKTGKVHDAKMIRWHIIFSEYFIKFIKRNFKKGMLVKVKGVAYPYQNMNPQAIDDAEMNDDERPVNTNVYGETIKQVFNSHDLNKDEKRAKKNVGYTHENIDDDF